MVLRYAIYIHFRRKELIGIQLNVALVVRLPTSVLKYSLDGFGELMELVERHCGRLFMEFLSLVLRVLGSQHSLCMEFFNNSLCSPVVSGYLPGSLQSW